MTVGTVKARDGSIFILDKSAEDFGEIDSDGTYANSATWGTIASLSFTPSTTSDYLIFASVRVSTNGKRWGSVRCLVDGATVYRSAGFQGRDTTDEVPYLAVFRLTNVSSIFGKTVAIQIICNGTVTLSYYRPEIVAINLDEFPEYSYTENTSEQSTTSTSYTNALTLTYSSPNNHPYVIFYYGIMRGTAGVTNADVHFKSIYDGNDYHQSIDRGANIGDRYFAFHTLVWKPRKAGTSVDYDIEYQAGSAGTAYIDDCVICAIQLNDTSSLQLNGANILGSTRIK